MPISGPLFAAFLLAQAEAAPEPPAPAGVAPSAAAEPEETPAAPATTPPAVALTEARKDFSLAIGLAAARRLGETAGTLGPRHGFEISTQLSHVYARPGGLEFAVGGGFAYQRFRSTVPIKILEGVSTLETDRTFSFYDFQVHQSIYRPLGPGGVVRPYVDVGGGFALAYFSSREPNLAPGEKRATRAIASATVGLDVMTTSQGARAGLALAVEHMFRAPPLAAPGDRQVEVFGDRATLRLTFLQPF